MATRRSIVIPRLLAVLHLSAAVGEPTLHARSEVLSSALALEAGHSDRCPVIHLEARCVAGGMHQIVGAMTRNVSPARPPVVNAPLRDRLLFLSSLGISPANGVRAPPRS